MLTSSQSTTPSLIPRPITTSLLSVSVDLHRLDISYKWLIQHVFFEAALFHFAQCSQSLSMLSHASICHNILQCKYLMFCSFDHNVYLFTSTFGVIMNNDAMNTHTCFCVDIFFYWWISSSEIAGLYIWWLYLLL